MARNVQQLLTEHIDLWTSAIENKSSAGRGNSRKKSLYGIKKLRELILELAVRGKLVAQDPNDEPASELLKRIAAERVQLVKEGKVKKQKQLPPISEEEKYFELPEGWEWSRMGSLAQYQKGYAFKSKDYLDCGLMITKIQNLTENHSQNSVYIAPEKALEFSQYLLQEGDVVMTTVGSWFSAPISAVGRSFLINKLFGDSLLNQNAVRIRPWKGLSSVHLFTCINSPMFKNYLVHEAQGTANQASITQDCIKTFLLCVPPKEEQHRIVAKVDELMALCDQLEQQTEQQLDAHQLLVDTLLGTLTQSQNANELADNWTRLSQHFDTLFTTEASIDQLKQTILQLAVMGKLVPQNPNDEPASELLKRIAAEKEQLIKDKKIKKQKLLPPISDEEKPFELPKGWEWCRSEDLAGFVDPQPSHRTPPAVEGGIPYVGYTDIDHQSGINFDNARRVSKTVFEEHQARYKLCGGDFVFGKIGTLGKPFFLTSPFDYCLSANLILIQPNINFVAPKFLALYLDSPQFLQVMGTQKTNSTHSVFGIKKARLLSIPLPSIAEQNSIIDKVNELFTLCDQLKERLQHNQQTQLLLTDTLVQEALNP